MAEGGGGRTPLLVSSSMRLEMLGEDSQPRGCCFQEQRVRMAKSLHSDPQGSRGEQSCVGRARELPRRGLSRTPTLVAPRLAAERSCGLGLASPAGKAGHPEEVNP